MIRRPLNKFVVVLFCILLGGCFKSRESLIDSTNASYPFKRASILMANFPDKGKTKAFSIERFSRSYEFTNLAEEDKQFKNIQIMFYKVNNETYVMQWRDSSLPDFDMFIIKITDNKFFMHTCFSYMDQTLFQLGIKKDGGRCSITNLGKLVRLAQVSPDEPRAQESVMTGEILLME